MESGTSDTYLKAESFRSQHGFLPNTNPIESILVNQNSEPIQREVKHEKERSSLEDALYVEKLFLSLVTKPYK